MTYRDTERAEEIIHDAGVLFVVINNADPRGDRPSRHGLQLCRTPGQTDHGHPRRRRRRVVGEIRRGHRRFDAHDPGLERMGGCFSKTQPTSFVSTPPVAR